MKRKRFGVEQIVAVLKQAEAGASWRARPPSGLLSCLFEKNSSIYQQSFSDRLFAPDPPDGPGWSRGGVDCDPPEALTPHQA
ncbi:MAG TPA: hypothetical protein VMJ11_00895 [Paraburkholderia sp.]|uniref:hypothetical protein n=1 Tax=Paraburkholderia sp. TaxID=1926495 RepID=UPI002C46AAF1|nr:hypothetical protein [Paraburkholderia sp.]HTR05233.1 hypothetical protein [Paraburkholderia sp.]